MYVEFEIGNVTELSQISLEDFDKDFQTIYGLMRLKLGDYILHDIFDEERFLDEYIVDISWHIDMLIECGIALLKDRYFKKTLLDLNLIVIKVTGDKDVKIEIIHIIDDETEEILYQYSISFDELVNEIKTVYAKYINDIKEINEVILQSRFIKSTINLYDEFLNCICKDKRLL